MMYGTAYVLVMGRHRRYRVLKSDPRKPRLMTLLRRWEIVGEVNADKFYSVLARNPRYRELDVEAGLTEDKSFTIRDLPAAERRGSVCSNSG